MFKCVLYIQFWELHFFTGKLKPISAGKAVIEVDINGKIYIGKTEFSIEKRFNEHCKDAFRDRNEKRPLYAAMRKYGIEHFGLYMSEHIDFIPTVNIPNAELGDSGIANGAEAVINVAGDIAETAVINCNGEISNLCPNEVVASSTGPTLSRLNKIPLASPFKSTPVFLPNPNLWI